MEIVVCIKQVPETTEVKIDSETGTLVRKGIPSEINPLDLHAIEEGLKIKESVGGRITIMSMGPPQAEDAIKDALAMGCDNGTLLTDGAFAGADTLATSYTLARGIKKLECFDLVICGMKTTDGDTAQVGPGLAYELGIPHIAYVNKIAELAQDHIVVEKMVEEGVEYIQCPLPCLITVVKGINEPRLSSLKLKIKARKTQIETLGLEDLGGDPSNYGLDGSPTRVVEVFTPNPPQKGEMIEGTPKTQAKGLFKKLKERKIL
ncbi:electron transfer flavoprotein subunit beta/FixA family protein [Candidatus Pacearchaeota archaeon]|nr:electron transfer flavoprotein subunit beta/FixA family protein [Candidatus Pacearchaeota archaeon]